jgi:hypothetical protein
VIRPSIHVQVPVRIRVEPNVLARRPEELDDALAAALGRVLERSGQALTAHAGSVAGVRFEPPQIAWAGDGLPDVDGLTRAATVSRVRQVLADGVAGAGLDRLGTGGHGKGMRTRRRRRPWVVLRAVQFQTLVGRFLVFVQSLDPRWQAADFALYADMELETRWVGVWWVQVNRTYLREELGPILAERASELAKVGERRVLAWGLSPLEHHRAYLVSLDDGGAVAAATPSLRARNARRVAGEFGSVEIRHGAWVLFSFMALPRIELADLLALDAPQRLEVPVGDVGFFVDVAAFEQRTGVAWSRFAEEFAAERVPLWLQPATVRRRTTRDAVFLLVHRHAGEQPAARQPTPGSAVQPAPSLMRLTEDLVAGLPAAVRQALPPPAGVPAGQGDTDPLLPGLRLLYALTWLDLGDDRLGRAFHGPRARHVAELLTARLPGDPDDRDWRNGMYDLLGRLGPPPSARPPGGTLFEHVLAELDAAGRLAALFDAADASGYVDLRYRLHLLALPTRYATHQRVTRFAQRLAQERLGAMRHHYIPGGIGVGEIWLERERDDRVVVGQVLGDVDDTFITTKELKQLKPTRAAALRKAMEDARNAIREGIYRGTDPTVYDEELFGREVVARAVAAVGLSDDDFKDVTIERSIRLLEVISSDPEGLPWFDVRFEFVQRIEGSGTQWTAVDKEVVESYDEFQARLIYWTLGRTGEAMAKAGMVIAVIGLIAVAWEAGLVAALISVAGGAKVVVWSIVISEIIYVIRVVFFDADLSLRGFFEAALDGYLTALGFRWGFGLGRWTAKAIGTQGARRVAAGMFLEKLAIATVGGGTSAVMVRFAHESIGAILDDGSLSGLDVYLRTMGFGMLVGVAAEFFVQPVLRALLAKGSSTFASAADLYKRLRAEGWSELRFSAALTEAMANLRATLTDAVGAVTAWRWVTIIGERLTKVGGSLLARRVLELSGARFTPQATAGLERFLAAAEAAAPQRAVALTNVFKAHAQETVHFLEVLAALEPAAARHLVAGTFGTQAELAAFLGRLARYRPAEQRAVIAMLGELGIEAAPGVPTLSPAQLLERQFATGLRVQATGLELEAQYLQGRSLELLRRAEIADASNPARAMALRAEADRLAAEATRQRTQATALREEAAGAAARPAAAALAGQARRVVYLDATVIDQVVRGNQAAADALLALRATADVRISRWTWIELVERPAQPRTATAQRLLVEDLGIAVDDAIPMAQRVDLVIESAPPSGRVTFSPADTQFAISARAGGGEVWSFDRAFRTNPGNVNARFGVQVAPESQLGRVGGAAQDFDRARRLLGLDPAEIAADGTVVRGRAAVALPSAAEAETVLARLEAAGADAAAGVGTQAWIRVPLQTVRQGQAALERVVRPVFRSRTGNRVVFRVQGGTGAAASQDMVRIDANGGVQLATRGRALNLNFGVFERAVEFLLAHRRGARLVVFEVEEGWFRSLRSAATPERGQPVVPGAPGIRDVTGVPRTVDVRFGPDQLQVPASLVPELGEFIVPNSGRVLEFTP